MPTLVSESRTIRRELWTADDFLDWLDPARLPDVAACLATVEQER